MLDAAQSWVTGSIFPRRDNLQKNKCLVTFNTRHEQALKARFTCRKLLFLSGIPAPSWNSILKILANSCYKNALWTSSQKLQWTSWYARGTFFQQIQFIHYASYLTDLEGRLTSLHQIQHQPTRFCSVTQLKPGGRSNIRIESKREENRMEQGRCTLLIPNLETQVDWKLSCFFQTEKKMQLVFNIKNSTS